MSTLRDWAELIRVSALFTVPGDAIAGAAAAGAPIDRRTLRAVGCSLCLYQAGMVLNDWADRDEDARERPHRPIPSGRIRPAAALSAAIGLTAAGLALAATAGRSAATVGGALAATVWAYDLKLKHTPAGPLVMGAARGLDLLLGAAVVGGRLPHRTVGTCASVLAVHTLAVTHVSRNETTGASTLAPLAALVTSAALGTALGVRHIRLPDGVRRAGEPTKSRADTPGVIGRARGIARWGSSLAPASFAALYAATSLRPYLHAALNPSPQLTQRAVGGGIRAMIPLQAALAARAGAPAVGAALLALVPLARRVARKVSLT